LFQKVTPSLSVIHLQILS